MYHFYIKINFLNYYQKKYYEGIYLPSFPVMQFIENLNINKFNSYNQKNFVNIIHDTYYTPGIIKKSEVKSNNSS